MTGNGWPFDTSPHRATLAQVLMFDEALRQLKEETTPKAPPKPRKLRGEAWERFKEKVSADGNY